MKVVINRCFGGFGLSSKAVEAYLARKGKQVYWFTDARDEMGRLEKGTDGRQTSRKIPLVGDPDEVIFFAYSYTSPEPLDDAYFYAHDIDRDDPDLVAVVEEMGSLANGQYAQLTVVEIPDGVKWEIDEYDGNETIDEKHRSWR